VMISTVSNTWSLLVREGTVVAQSGLLEGIVVNKLANKLE
jgi:hypothetical protein